MASKNPSEVKKRESLPECSVLFPFPITQFIKKYFKKIFILECMDLKHNACLYTQTREMLSGNLIMLQFLMGKQGNIFKGTLILSILSLIDMKPLVEKGFWTHSKLVSKNIKAVQTEVFPSF